MNNTIKFFLGVLTIVLLGGWQTTNAAAGWMDKISQVTGRVNQTTQSIQQIKQTKQQVQDISSSLPKPSAKKNSEQEPSDDSSINSKTAKSKKKAKKTAGFELTKTTNPIKGEWGTQVTCAGANSATCQNGMDNLVNCMHQTKGYYYRLAAANLQGRLDTDQDLTDDDRAILEEDIASLNEAVQTDKVVDPDPEYQQRWLDWLTEEDQQEINGLNSKYMNEVRQDCDERFGGMSQFSNK